MATQTAGKDVPVKTGKPEQAPTRVEGPFDEIERVLEQLAPGGFFRPVRWDRSVLPQLAAFESRMPKLDVIDRDDEIIVKAEVPGVKKEDISVSVTGDRITIRGESKREEKEEKGDYYRCETTRGEFSRTVTLPAEVDDTKAKAQMTDGMLEIHLPKREQAKKRDIQIS